MVHKANKVTKIGSKAVRNSNANPAMTKGAKGIPKLLTIAEKMPKTKRHLGAKITGKKSAKKLDIRPQNVYFVKEISPH